MPKTNRTVDPAWFRRGRLAVPIIGILASIGVGPRLEPIVVTGLKHAESAREGPNGRVYLTVLGEPGRSGDGGIVIVDPLGKIKPFVANMDDPRGLAVVGDSFFVADRKRVWRVDARGKTDLYAGPESFPRPPVELKDVVADAQGTLYITDVGDRRGNRGAIFAINIRQEVSLVMDAELTMPRIQVPSGLLVDDRDHLFVGDRIDGTLYRYDLALATLQPLGGGFGGVDGLARDTAGRLFVGDSSNGRLFGFYSELEPPRLINDRFRSVGDIAISRDGKFILIPDREAGTLTWFPVP